MIVPILVELQLTLCSIEWCMEWNGGLAALARPSFQHLDLERAEILSHCLSQGGHRG